MCFMAWASMRQDSQDMRLAHVASMVTLIPLKLDHQSHDVVVNFMVLRDLASQPPVVGVGHHHLEYLEVTAGASEHVLEPDW
jgi:hypothetical protein